MEPDKLDMVVETVENYNDEDYQNNREYKLKVIAKEFALMSKEAHDSNFGALDFHIQDGDGLSMATYKSGEAAKIGCLVIIIVIIVIVVLINI